MCNIAGRADVYLLCAIVELALKPSLNAKLIADYVWSVVFL